MKYKILCLIVVATIFTCFILFFGLLIPVQAAGERGRVKVVNNLLVADNGAPLRGENPRLKFWPEDPTHLSYWQRLRDFHLNTVRIIAYREPQFYNSSACGYSCESRWDLLNASDVDVNNDGQLTGSEKTTWDGFMDRIFPYLDTWVDEAGRNGFYIIIDYHPVGGLDMFDAREWWTKVAPRYKDRTHVVYELANEPVGSPAWGPAGYTPAMINWEKEMYQYLRSVAPNTHIILWSFANAGSGMKEVVDQAAGVDYTNASVAFHIYSRSTSAINSLKSAYPVFASEMGGDSAAEYDTKVGYVENIGVKSWIILDGTLPEKAVTVTWPADPFFTNISSPSPTVSDLKASFRIYLTSDDLSYKPVDGKVNMLDGGWVVKLLVN